jgi:hypothetical protein
MKLLPVTVALLALFLVASYQDLTVAAGNLSRPITQALMLCSFTLQSSS